MRYMLIASEGERLCRRYATKEAALAAAQRHLARIGEGTEVVWCDDTGKPKVWMAYVTPLGVEYTQFWEDFR